MRTLFFVDDLPTTVGSTYEFNNDDALHAIRVLRTKSGDDFNLSDGKGNWSHVRAKEVHKKHMTVEVLETGHQDVLETHFTIIQAIPKGDRIKEAIELCTEGGADRIVMWKAARSIGKSDDKIEKLQTTAREASKQSRRFRIPEVMGVAATNAVVDQIAQADLAIVFHESATMKISEVVAPGCTKVAIIIGPEGGLTDDEIDTFAAAGAKVALMGRPVLRSAHAGLAALSAVNTALSVW
ncbi:16S rRNA (uracil(1498)-N(3))-methyltransferase [Candidatus Planktophila dulcis]|uniref:16S rRNA (uracil(1498)-N(3))-methyltransferase n=1 Tax=Candidatus Planktophila dulcis TaxID=1884914 RepID=UPI003CF1C7BE